MYFAVPSCKFPLFRSGRVSAVPCQVFIGGLQRWKCRRPHSTGDQKSLQVVARAGLLGLRKDVLRVRDVPDGHVSAPSLLPTLSSSFSPIFPRQGCGAAAGPVLPVEAAGRCLHRRLHRVPQQGPGSGARPARRSGALHPEPLAQPGPDSQSGREVRQEARHSKYVSKMVLSARYPFTSTQHGGDGTLCACYKHNMHINCLCQYLQLEHKWSGASLYDCSLSLIRKIS